ncbi:hypothetical protein EDC04DRAFT_362854 [Pisolithus marmoratus]|nr:hypothetical protein EDC04DRAFT_362854 [Pisolithus marmoratus]
MFSMRYTGRRKRSATRSSQDHSLVEGCARNSTTSSPSAQPYIQREHNVSFHSLHMTGSIPYATHGPQAPSCSTPSSPLASLSSSGGNRFSPHPFSAPVSPLVDGRYVVERSTSASESAGSKPLRFSQASPTTPRFRSTTESDIQFPQYTPRRNRQGLLRPSTAPHLSPHPFSTGIVSDVQIQGRAFDLPNRFTMGIKSLLSKPAQPSPSRYSLYSSPSDSEVPSPLQCMPRKFRPPDLDVAACPSSPPQASSLSDAHRRQTSEAIQVSGSSSSLSPLTDYSYDSPERQVPGLSRGRDEKPRNVLRRRPSSTKSLKEKRDKATVRIDKGSPVLDLSAAPPLPSARLEGRQTPTIPISRTQTWDEVIVCNGSAHRPSLDTRNRPRDHIDGQRVDADSTTSTIRGDERRVAAGGPEDRWIGLDGQVLAGQRTRITQTGGHGRSLSRKMSAQWKKVTGGIITPDQSPSHASPKAGHSKGSPSLQEWSGARSKDRTRCIGGSMDGMGVLSGQNDVLTGPTAGRGRAHTDPSTESTDAKTPSEGGRLWGLMKRISTGGLRERFQADKDTVVPPVPTIPKDLVGRVNHTGRPNQSTDNEADKPGTPPESRRRRCTSPERRPQAYPSGTTLSPSPNSDVASNQFFQRPQSAKSSVSSFSEIKTPVIPELDRHIIPPSEQLRLGEGASPGSNTTSPQLTRCRSPSVSPCPLSDFEADKPLRSASSRGSHGDASVMSNHAILADGGVSLSPPPPRSRGRLRTSTSPISSQPYREGAIVVSSSARVSSVGRPSLEQPYVRAQMTFRELNAPRKTTSYRAREG